MKRFCYCSTQRRLRELVTSNDIPKQNNDDKYEKKKDEKKKDENQENLKNEKKDQIRNALPSVSSNSYVLQPTFWIFVLAPFVACMSALSASGSGGSIGSIGSMKNCFGIFFVLLLLSTQQCLAHNWISVSGSRGKGAATPTSRPCSKRHGTSVGAQLGPGQFIDFKFSTGHGTYTYLFVVPGHLTHHLAIRNKVSFYFWILKFLNF